MITLFTFIRYQYLKPNGHGFSFDAEAAKKVARSQPKYDPGPATEASVH